MNRKKFSLLLTFLLVGSLLLAACANNGTNNNGLGNNNTGVVETEIPVTGPEDMATEVPPVVDEEPVVETPIATEIVEEDVVETPVDDVDDLDDGEDDLDEEVFVPECLPNRLSHLADYDVLTSDGVLVGEVEALVVLRPANSAYGVDESLFVDGDLDAGDPEDTADEAADNAAVEATETADDDAADDTLTEDAVQEGTIALPINAAAPVVGYVVVDIDNASLEDLNLEDGDLLLPFSAIQPLTAGPMGANDIDLADGADDVDDTDNDAADTDDAADDLADDDVAGDDAADDAVGADDTAGVMVDGCALTLNLVATDLATAPIFEDDAWDFTVDGWDADVTAYAQGLGFAVPTLAGGAESRPVIVEEDSFDIDVENLNDEDLGDIVDFIINPQDGTFTHGILQTGSFLGLGGRYIPVPVSHMLWVDEDDDLEDMGEIIIPVEDGAFDEFPEFDLDRTDFSDETWDDELESFWTNIVTE